MVLKLSDIFLLVCLAGAPKIRYLDGLVASNTLVSQFLCLIFPVSVLSCVSYNAVRPDCQARPDTILLSVKHCEDTMTECLLVRSTLKHNSCPFKFCLLIALYYIPHYILILNLPNISW